MTLTLEVCAMATATKNRLAGNGEATAEAKAEAKEKPVLLAITPPNMAVVKLLIRGTAPYVSNRFSKRAGNTMREAQVAGSQAKKGKKREPKDFDACYEESKHISRDGWCGIPAPGFRTAMVDACRLVGFKMTHAKLGVFVVADGYDR